MPKRKEFNSGQLDVLEREGLKAYNYELVRDLPNSMIVRNKITDQLEIIEKWARGDRRIAASEEYS